MSYAHKMNSMYEHSSCMIFVLSYMINVDHSLYHDPYPKTAKTAHFHITKRQIFGDMFGVIFISILKPLPMSMSWICAENISIR